MSEKYFYPKDSGISEGRIEELVTDIFNDRDLIPPNVKNHPAFHDDFCQRIADEWNGIWKDEDTLDKEFEEEIIKLFS